MQQMWTRGEVEARLVAAFTAMPACPVYGRAGRLRAAATNAGNDVTNVLAWAWLLDGDPDARKVLWAWARCRATRESFSELCREMGWARATVEAVRRRGADAIAARLNEACAIPDDPQERSCQIDLTARKPATERPPAQFE